MQLTRTYYLARNLHLDSRVLFRRNQDAPLSSCESHFFLREPSSAPLAVGRAQARRPGKWSVGQWNRLVRPPVPGTGINLRAGNVNFNCDRVVTALTGTRVVTQQVCASEFGPDNSNGIFKFTLLPEMELSSTGSGSQQRERIRTAFNLTAPAEDGCQLTEVYTGPEASKLSPGDTLKRKRIGYKGFSEFGKREGIYGHVSPVCLLRKRSQRGLASIVHRLTDED